MPSKRMVPEQEVSDAGEDLVRLAAAKNAEINRISARLRRERIQANAEIAALTEQRGRAMKVVEAARRWRKEEWGAASSKEIRHSRRHTVDELDESDGSMALIDALDAEAAAETAPSLPETPEAT